MATWDDHDLDYVVGRILKEVPVVDRADSMGRPFITSYQIAVKVQHEYPQVFTAIGKEVGGVGGGRGSLAQLIGQELARRVKGDGFVYSEDGETFELEGAWLSHQDLETLTFRSSDGLVTATPNQAGFDLGLFRLRRAIS